MATTTGPGRRPPSARYPSEETSGCWAFAGVMLVVAGGFDLIDGIASLARKSYFSESSLLYENLTLWGWIAIVIGAIQPLAIGAYPWWAAIILVTDALIIFGLTRSRVEE